MAATDGVDREALAKEFARVSVGAVTNLRAGRRSEALFTVEERMLFTEFCEERVPQIASALRLAARVEAAKGDAAEKAAREHASGIADLEAAGDARIDFAAGWRAHERAIGGGSDE